MLKVFSFTSIMFLVVTLAQASVVNITSLSHYCEGSVTYFDSSGNRHYQEYTDQQESLAQGSIQILENLCTSSISTGLSAIAGISSAYGSCDAGANSAYGQALVICDFMPLKQQIHIPLTCSVNAYPGEIPSGAWALLFDLTANVLVDSVWLTKNSPSELADFWAGSYSMDVTHLYRLTLEAAVDASDDGGWYAQISAAIVAPEPAASLVILLGLPLMNRNKPCRKKQI